MDPDKAGKRSGQWQDVWLSTEIVSEHKANTLGAPLEWGSCVCEVHAMVFPNNDPCQEQREWAQKAQAK